MQHRDLPASANAIIAQQGWDLESITTHLIGFIQQHGPIAWETRLTDYFTSCADDENQDA